MKKFGALILMGSMIMLVGGCLNNGATDQTAPTEQSALSFYDADPDGNNLSIIMNGIQINAVAFQFKTYTGYSSIEPGVKTFKFTSTSTGSSLHDTTYTLATFKPYTIFVGKRLNSTNLVSVITDDSGTIQGSGNTVFRFANMSPDTPAVDVRIVGKESTPIALGIKYLQVGGYVEFSPSDDTVEIRRSSDQKLIQSIAVTSATSGLYQTIILSGYNTLPPGNLNGLSVKVVH